MGFFQRTQERVRNSRGKQATSVRATEGLLCMFLTCMFTSESLIGHYIHVRVEKKNIYHIS